MADSKVSLLPNGALTGADLATGDKFYAVDVSATTAGSKWILSSELAIGLFKAVTAPMLVNSGDGINFDTAAGDDADIDILTLDVTGIPKLWWDESEDAFVHSKPLQVENVKLTGTGTDCWCVNSKYNVIESGTTTGTISGGGSVASPNRIGSTSKPAVDHTTIVIPGWAADSGYVANSAEVATIVGGYDNVNNQAAGVLAGAHNFIKYNLEGHSAIYGGSYNLVSAGRSGIFAAYASSITGAYVGSFVGGGRENNIAASYSAIVTGLNCDIAAGCHYSLAMGRRAKITAYGCVALADSTDADFTVATNNMFGARYAGGFYLTGGLTTLDRNAAGAGVDTLKLDNAGTAANEVGLSFYSSATDSTTSARTGRIFGVWDTGSYSGARLTFQTMTSGDTLNETLSLQNKNVGIGGHAFGTSSALVLAITTGTAPASSPADVCQLYSADQAAGNACLHTRTEGGAVIKLYQGAAVADATDAATTMARLNDLLAILRAQGHIAT